MIFGDKRRFRQARARSNPYERISSAHFQNRAALKLSELDASFTPALTDTPLLEEENGVLYFADICAGPGGFTEYVYWRKKWACKGWGFTLKGDCDFQLRRFYPKVSAQTFEPLYGYYGDGDIFKSANIKHFELQVLAATNDRGVALVTADGGFNTDGDWNRQEFLTKRLLLCQYLTALCVLREGGAFVCKMFDTFTDFTVELMYIMTHLFENTYLTKPVQSRPANSERFFVCRGFRGSAEPTISYFFWLNDQLEKLGFIDASSKPTQDISHIYTEPTIDFLQAVRQFVERVSSRQITALEDVVRYYKDPSLSPPADQEAVRKHAMDLWQIPDLSRADIGRDCGIICSMRHQSIHDQLWTIMPSWLREFEKGLSAFPTLGADVNIPVPDDCAVIPLDEGTAIGLLVGLLDTVAFVNRNILNKFAVRSDLRLPNGTILLAEHRRDDEYSIIDAHLISWDPLVELDYTARRDAIATLVSGSNACHTRCRVSIARIIQAATESFSVLRIPIKPSTMQDAVDSYRVVSRYLSGPLLFTLGYSVSGHTLTLETTDRNGRVCRIAPKYAREITQSLLTGVNIDQARDRKLMVQCIFDFKRRCLTNGTIIARNSLMKPTQLEEFEDLRSKQSL